MKLLKCMCGAWAVAALTAGTACATDPGATAAVDGQPLQRDVCHGVAGAQVWARTELYFGTSKADGSLITEDDYQHFLDTEVTPRFGDGFTLLSGRGQFRGANGTIVREPAKVLILFYPFDEEKNVAVDEIRNAFRKAFRQEAVLRADGTACVAL